jgi:mRNA interferase RelE/StbE
LKTLIYSDRAAKQLDALPVPVQAQIIEALAQYAMNGVGDVKKLSGSDTNRLRIGRYRVIFAEDRITVIAIQVGKRETATYNRT